MTLSPGQVEVTIESFDRLPADSSLLSTAELDRASRFATTTLAQRWISGRAWLRTVLSTYVDEDPRQLELGTGQYGRPHLVVGRGIDFNLSHTDTVIGLAVSRASVGLDLESRYAGADLLEVAAIVCTEAELAELAVESADSAAVGFARMWTRKEAVLKAEGSGLMADPTALEVGTGPTPRQQPQWSIRDLGPLDLSSVPVWCAVASGYRKPDIFLRMP